MTTTNLQATIDAARAASIAVAEIKNQERLAGSLQALENEQARLQRADAIARELSAILPALHSRLEVVAGEASAWRVKRDALAEDAQALAVAHRMIEAHRLEAEQAAQLAIVQLSSQFPPAELGGAIAEIQSALRAGRASAQTVVNRYSHAATIDVDRLIDFIARQAR